MTTEVRSGFAGQAPVQVVERTVDRSPPEPVPDYTDGHRLFTAENAYWWPEGYGKAEPIAAEALRCPVPPSPLRRSNPGVNGFSRNPIPGSSARVRPMQFLGAQPSAGCCAGFSLCSVGPTERLRSHRSAAAGVVCAGEP
jgi:hypothetical protein